MKQKIIAALMISAALSACASIDHQLFHGKSTTYNSDNILRNDVFKQIKRQERLAFHCNHITSVDSRIQNVQQIAGRFHVEEQWRIQACGKERVYHISLRQDERGETDFTVGAR